jgi:hypothetical protein
MKKCGKCQIEKPLDKFGKNKDYFQQWWVNNRDKKRQYHLNDKAKRHHVHKWRDLLSNTLQQLKSSKSNTTQQLLGYSAIQLKEHLGKQNINWETDHIDHKIPVSWFKSNTPPHIVNDLRNLQPISAEENRSKLNRFGSPTDISYIHEIEKYIKEKYLYELWKLNEND